jgi:hypothetical protein
MPLDVNARLRQADGELELDATTEADHSALGMSNGVLGMIRTPSELTVRGRLVAETD